MHEIAGALAPGKSTANNNSQMDRPGERDLMLAALRAASARVRLAANSIDLIGSSLRQKAINCQQALEWAADEGVIDWIHLRGEVSR